MNDTSLVQVEHLFRYYGDLCAVRDVSFTIERGEVMGFLGPNGAGKSTTMQIISGNLAPSAGQVRIDGFDILDEPRLAKARIGYLPEQPPLYRELTVDEFLRYCARLNQIPREQCTAAMDAAKQRCGLADVGRRLIGNLSKGYQQRVGIAQAIIHSPAVVILDEPTVGLDPIQIREIRALIRDLAREHSVILSTHILPEVEAICDRVQIIHRGELVLHDSIAGLRRRMQSSALVATFHNAPPTVRFESIPGVLGAEELADGRVRIHYPHGESPAEHIVEQSVAQGWRLYDISAERVSLEEIFVDITHTDAAAPETGGPEEDAAA